MMFYFSNRLKFAVVLAALVIVATPFGLYCCGRWVYDHVSIEVRP